MIDEEIKLIGEALAEPFKSKQIKWRPGRTNGSRALALAYIDARMIERRLDAVVGVAGWKDTYDFLPSGEVICTLSLFLRDQWIGKQGVGKPSKQPDAGDRVKAGSTDAYKRAAAKWGIARYLYFLGPQWADYDPQRKILTSVPTLPSWALPKDDVPQQAAPTATVKAGVPAWFGNVNNWLIENRLAEDDEARTYVLEHHEGIRSLHDVSEETGRQVLGEFGRLKIRYAVDAEFERTRMAYQDAVGNPAMRSAKLPASVLEATDQQMLKLILFLRNIKSADI